MPIQWCPPCRGFTPVLSAWYQEMQAKITASAGSLPSLEIVFVSWDNNETEFSGYLKTMPFKAVDFVAQATRDALSKDFGVRSIPTLIFVRRDGSILTRDGRALVASDGSAYPWMKRISEQGSSAAAVSASPTASWGFYVLLGLFAAVVFALLVRSG